MTGALSLKLRRIAALLLFWFIFKFFDPLGLEAATKNASTALFVALTAPFHGVGEAAVQDQLAVVLVTDHTLDVWGGRWPAAVSRHARAIEALLDAKPKAVVVDFRFAKPRPGEDLHEFDDAIAAADQAGIPLLFSQGQLGNGFGDLPEPLTRLGTVTGWEGDASRYRLLVSAPNDGAGAEEGAKSERKAWPTASFDVYERLCASDWLPTCHGPIDRTQFDRPMVVRYGLELDRHQRLTLDTAQCGQFGGGLLRRLGEGASLALGVLSARFRTTANSVAQRCPTFLTVNAEDLERMVAGQPDQPVSELLVGRVVFYGSDIRGDHDVADVPFRGQIPGVTLLASAFENLLLYGPNYFKQPATVIDEFIEIGWGDLMEAAVWLLLVTLLVLREDHLEWIKDLEDDHARLARILLAVALGGALAILAVHDYQSRGAENVGRPVAIGGALLYAAAYLVLLRIISRWHQLGDTYRGRLFQLTGVTLCLFICNEAWLHWPNGDWLGLVLLFVALGEAFEGKPGSFVADVEKGLIALGSFVADVGRRLIALGRRLPWFH